MIGWARLEQAPITPPSLGQAVARHACGAPDREFARQVASSAGSLVGQSSYRSTVRRAPPTEPHTFDEGRQVLRQDHHTTSPLRGAMLSALIAAVLLLLTACSFEVGVGGEDFALSEVAVSSAVDADGTPAAVTSSFEVDAPVIYVAALVDGADEGAQVTMTWSHETEGVFAEVPIDLLEGSSRPYSDVTRPDAGWPTGSYAVDVVATSSDGESVSDQVTFQVVE